MTNLALQNFHSYSRQLLQNIILHKSCIKVEMNEYGVKLTSKYGLQAERTTLWAFRYFPSAASVQSTNVPDTSSVSKFCINVDWWLFHLRQNCWSSSIFLPSICNQSRKARRPLVIRRFAKNSSYRRDEGQLACRVHRVYTTRSWLRVD